MAYLRMEDTDVYLRATKLSNLAYGIVGAWEFLPQRTVGIQLVRALDSIGANLVEGDGRETRADGVRFLVMARASARESRHWLGVARDRALINEPEASQMNEEITVVGKMVSKMIEVRKATRAVREETASYDPLKSVG
ncbi:four helix bundle protein [bacterium]|nr:MAG: four helix bundle protein [bacterium]